LLWLGEDGGDGMCSSASTETWSSSSNREHKFSHSFCAFHSHIFFLIQFQHLCLQKPSHYMDHTACSLWSWNHSQRECIPCSDHQAFFCSILVREHKLCSQTPLGVWFLVSFQSTPPVELSSICFWLDFDSECRWHGLQPQPRKLWASASTSAWFSSCSGLLDSLPTTPFCWGEYGAIIECRIPCSSQKVSNSFDVNSPPLSDLMDFKKYPLSFSTEYNAPIPRVRRRYCDVYT